METPFTRDTREILVESFEYDQKTIIPILLSPRGQKILVNKYGQDNNWKIYWQTVKKATATTHFMNSKLEDKNAFQDGFIKFLQPRFESLFVHLRDGTICLKQEDKDSAQIRFNKLRKIYEELYPDSDFNIDDLMDGKDPYNSGLRYM